MRACMHTRSHTHTHVLTGSNGRTGEECVRYCVATNRRVRALSRTGAVPPISSPLVSSSRLDVSMGGIESAVAGASVVIFAATASARGDPRLVDNLGLEATAKACIAAGVERLVVVSGAGVTKHESQAYKFLNLFGRRMDEKVAGEQAVRRLFAGAPAHQDYTIVRPSGLLSDRAPLGAAGLELNQGDENAGFICRADVAAVCIECAFSPAAAHASFECYMQGTATATQNLRVSAILSNPTAAEVVKFVMREESRSSAPVITGREMRASEFPALFSKLQQDKPRRT